MADRKISDLTALTAPASGDYLPIVDISEAAAADKNKRITIEELFRGIPLGSAAAPSIAIEGDENTGIYSPGADQLAISTNGTGRLFVDASGNVGVGTASEPRRLHVSNGYSAATSIDGSIALLVTNNAGANDFAGVGIIGGGTSGGSFIHFGDTANAGIGRIGYFHSDNSFRINTNGSEAIRIDSSQRVGIGGVTSPGQALEVAGNGVFTGGVSGQGAYIYRDGATGGGVYSSQSGSVVIAAPGANYIDFQTNSSPRARIDSSGRLLVGTSSGSNEPRIVVVGNQGNNNGSGWLALGRGESASTIFANEGLGVVSFTDNAQNEFARIQADADAGAGTGDYPGRLVFSTTADGASSPTERMRITNDGRVLLGATTGDSGLVVDRAVSRAALGTTAPARIYTGAGTITDNTTVASGTVAHGTIVSFDNPAIAATNASVTYTRASTLYVDGAPTAGTNVTISNRYGLFVNAGNTVLGENVTIGGAVIPASATASLTLINGTIPSASVVNGVSLYAEDVSASSELKVRDEAGNITTLSPHNFSLIPEGPSEEMAWAFYSERDGTKINVDMLKAIRLLEQLTGEQLVYLSEAQ